MSNFRRIVVHDVWIVRMACGVVLVIGLGWIESLQRNYLGHDGALEDFGFFELCDIRLGDSLLFFTAIENGRELSGQEDAAVSSLHQVKIGNACEGY